MTSDATSCETISAEIVSETFISSPPAAAIISAQPGDMIVAPLAAGHRRGAFRSGTSEFDRYFRSQAGRDAVRLSAAVFVLVMPDEKIAGYYTLAPATVLLPDLLGNGTRKTSRYPPMSAVRLARLAIDKRRSGRGFDIHLLADAMVRAQAMAGVVALIADAPSKTVQDFYARQNLAVFPDRPDRYFWPMAGN
jgi:hypothetical protein